MSKIFIIDPRGNFDINDTDVISRHISYVASYQIKYNEKLQIDVLGASKLMGSSGVCAVKVMNRTRNFVIFAIRSLKYLSNERNCVFIASDPWFSFASAKLIVFLRQSGEKIQLQLHGQYLSPKHSRLRNYITMRYLRYCIIASEETRFVNEIEFERICKTFEKGKKKVFYSPVPINPVFLEKNQFHDRSRPLVLGFIGRLHAERGLWSFVRLARVLKKYYPNLSLRIIGVGEERVTFEKNISEEFGSSYDFVGFLTPEELRDQMNQIGVLASCAPTESYGRAMREALLCGVPVLAISSDGSTHLQRDLPLECIQVFDFNEDSDEDIVRKFKFLQESSFCISDIGGKLGMERDPGSKLIESWRRLIDMNRSED